MNAAAATTTTTAAATASAAALSRSPTPFKMTHNTRIIFGARCGRGARRGQSDGDIENDDDDVGVRRRGERRAKGEMR